MKRFSIPCLPTALLVVLLAPSTVQGATSCVRNHRMDLSDLAEEVLANIEAGSVPSDSPVERDKILSTCNRFISLHIDGPDIFSAARDFIALADHEVDMAFYEWDDETLASRLIGDGLIAAQARRTPQDPLLVRMIRDDVVGTSLGRAVNEFYDSQKEWVSRGLDTSRVHLQFGTAPRSTQISPNLHDKFIIVDGKYLLITGANVQRHFDPDELWHDSGYVFEGDVALSALSSFERTWTDKKANHWECRPQTASRDCDKRRHYPQPDHGWLPPFGSQQPGDVPVLAVGRVKGGIFSNDTSNPQDIAWATVMEEATSHIYVETPNINDNAFYDAVLDAVQRGVTVRLITGLGFNERGTDVPVLGGSNLEVVGNLRKEVRDSTQDDLEAQQRFQVRWYGKDGREWITDNNNGASHTKYMSVDSRVAVVGSGNQDTISWNISHELNVLLDDALVTAGLEDALFHPDWNTSVGSYLELYEGNGGTQDIVCPIAVRNNKSVHFDDQPLPLVTRDTWRCNNDEARSLLLHDVDVGRVFRFFDAPRGRFEDDDWTEIVVKRPVSRKYIDSFERSFEDADVLVTYHYDNGLDGKVSAAEVASLSAGPVVDLYEGNGGTQSLVCSIQTRRTSVINFRNHPYCDNDEARSLVLSSFPTDKAIFLYDDPGGSTGDDWVIIVPRRPITRATVGSFESSYQDEDLEVCSFPRNGLDGKVSRIRIGPRSEAAGLCGEPLPPSRSYTLSPEPSATYPDSGGELTDGITNTGTDWINAVGWLYLDPTITLDLGQSVELSDVQMYVGNSFNNGSFGVARPANVAVSVSDDGAIWTEVGDLSFSVFSHGGTKWQVDLGNASIGATGRFVRFTIARGGPWVMVTEIAVNGHPEPPPPLGFVYTFSPEPSTTYPDSGGELTDGVTDTGTDWINAAGWLYVDPTITLDLGQVQSFSEVRLYVGNSFNDGSFGVARPADVMVSVSNDGVSWTSVGSLSFGVFSDGETKWQVDLGSAAFTATGRWVRLEITRGGPWTMVTEIAVNGS